jgi:hypothetical protein
VDCAITGRPVGLSLGCKEGSLESNTVGCVLGKLLDSLDGRPEDVILGLALGSSLGFDVGNFD